MKDYAKYDFEAIRGACVEMEIAPTENPAIHAAINGMVVYQDPTSILVLRNSGTVTCFLRSEILSLTAKIKVEDMSLKQMMEFCFIKGDCNYVVLYNDKTCVATCGKHAKNIELKDYIDCTDWGWESYGSN